MRVLVVDDEMLIRNLLTTALSRAGHEVRAAVHGLEALHHVRTWLPDIIFLDLQMPVMSGQAFVAAYARERLPHALIVVMSAFYDRSAVKLQLPVYAVLQKPFRLHEVTDLLERSRVSASDQFFLGQ